MRIPQHNIARAHSKPDWYSDSPKAVKDGRSIYTDKNIQPLLNGVGVIHDDTPRQGGWRYLAVGNGRRRLLTAEELDTPYSKWPRSKFVRLRRTKRPGIRYETRVRPYVYVEMLQVHKRAKKIPCWEAKNPFPQTTAEAMVRIARSNDMPCFVMTLVHQTRGVPKATDRMTVAGAKLRTFHGVGAQTALLTHGYPPPPDLETWRPYIDTFWGHNAEEYRR